ncbi:hypothetical protein Pcinc_006641 [Petrolisthes cinctipes]|uniref:Uncharacterized protein n=1 Tax=Petrolisthes cinctipes TaxID=88211 RepID=A0AAE1GCT5_PETCI|nr:hypothetical protein Pcinc_006641 [Petrolisthes cinctipes]
MKKPGPPGIPVHPADIIPGNHLNHYTVSLAAWLLAVCIYAILSTCYGYPTAPDRPTVGNSATLNESTSVKISTGQPSVPGLSMQTHAPLAVSCKGSAVDTQPQGDVRWPDATHHTLPAHISSQAPTLSPDLSTRAI